MDRIEGVPDGWRLVRITDDPKTGEHAISVPGRVIIVSDPYEWDLACIVERIEPAQPKYRPFANEEEFKRHRYRWVRVKANGNVTRPSSYTHDRVCVSLGGWLNWRESFEYLEFDDGTPFGVEVIEA